MSAVGMGLFSKDNCSPLGPQPQALGVLRPNGTAELGWPQVIAPLSAAQETEPEWKVGGASTAGLAQQGHGQETKDRVPVPVIPPDTLLSPKVSQTRMCLCRTVLGG